MPQRIDPAHYGKYKLPLIISSIIITTLLSSSAAYFTIKSFAGSNPSSKKPPSLLSPLTTEENSLEISFEPVPPPTALSAPFHLLLLGLDRRSRNQAGYRTDAIMVVSISKANKKVLLTSIPRDLWLDGTKINAHYAGEGFDKFKERINKVVGIEPSHYVSADFEALVWAVDELGGAEPDIERGFADYNYPDDRPQAPHPPSFQAGIQKLNGEEALQYCRSRKGTAGEGSDFRRMRRQQNLLTNLPQAFEKSSLAKLGAEALYNLLSGHIETNLGVGETASLLLLFTNWKNYKIEKVVLDLENFLYHPPMANYGGAYVLRPQNDSFEAIHQYIREKLGKGKSQTLHFVKSLTLGNCQALESSAAKNEKGRSRFCDSP